MKKNLFYLALVYAIGAAPFSQLAKAQNTAPYWSLTGNSNAGSTSKLGTTNAINLGLFTNNHERIRITSAGNIGINTTNPLTKFQVIGNASFGANVTTTNSARALNVVDGNAVIRILRVHPTNAPAIELISRTSSDGPNVAYWDCYAEPHDQSFRIRDRKRGAPGPDRITIDTMGNVGIGTILPTDKLHVVADGHVAAIHAESSYLDEFDSRYYGGPAVLAVGGTYGIEAESLDRYGAGIHATGDVGMIGQGLEIGTEGITYSNTEGVGIYGRGGIGGQFDGPVIMPAAYTTSDKNLKKNIREFSDAMSLINKLKPKYYEFKDDAKLTSLHLPKGSHYGLIAQELEEVAPDLIKQTSLKLYDTNTKFTDTKTKDGKKVAVPKPQEILETISVKAVNYTELIPVVIKGMQEQQIQIEKQQEQMKELNEKNEELEREVSELKSLVLKNGNGTPVNSLTGYLKQNAPNPAGNNTVISYSLPGNSGRAEIRITDARGSTIKVYNTSAAEGRVTIKNGEFSAGTYNYSLYVKDKIIDTKQMVITP